LVTGGCVPQRTTRQGCAVVGVQARQIPKAMQGSDSAGVNEPAAVNTRNARINTIPSLRMTSLLCRREIAGGLP
jgi:hypothetical protein